MDEELLNLLARLSDADNPLSDEELSDLRTRVLAIVAEIDVTNPSDDDLAVLEEAGSAVTAIQAEIDTRATATAERAARAAELRAAIPGADEIPAPEEESAPTGEEPTAEETPTTEGAPEEPTAEVEPAAPVEPEVEPVAAAATPEFRLPSISRLAHRRPASHRPVPTATAGLPRAVLTASADIPGLGAGAEVDPEQWARGVVHKYDSFRKLRGPEGDGEKVHLGTVRFTYPDDRMLDDDEMGNEEKINAVASPAALVASGGVCSPVAVDYTLSTIGQAGRPVRDSLAGFGAARGGLRYVLPHTLAQVTADAPASVWTEANDVALNSPATKPHATFTCQGVQQAFVDAVTSITKFGNFQARYFPEQIAQYLETVDAVHARLAEATLLAALTSGSTAVSADSDLLGAARELLAVIDRSAAAYRYRNRMAPEAPLRLVWPEWVEDMIRADLVRQLPGDSGGQAERLATTDAQIDAFLSVRNINVTNTQDSPTGASPFQGFLAQGAGLLNPWPEKVTMWLFHEGAWMFLDGGELNLGMFRDSTLNATNDFEMFSETFEKAIFRGHESLAITADVCPSGQSAGTVDTSGLCVSGS